MTSRDAFFAAPRVGAPAPQGLWIAASSPRSLRDRDRIDPIFGHRGLALNHRLPDIRTVYHRWNMNVTHDGIGAITERITRKLPIISQESGSDKLVAPGQKRRNCKFGISSALLCWPNLYRPSARAIHTTATAQTQHRDDEVG